MKIERTKTCRGFALLRFTDTYGEGCSLQQSSSVCPHVWLGVDDAKPQVLASEAHSVGVETPTATGWVPYSVPDNVLMTTRMHLDRRRALRLAIELLWFAVTGRLRGGE